MTLNAKKELKKAGLVALEQNVKDIIIQIAPNEEMSLWAVGWIMKDILKEWRKLKVKKHI